MENLDQTEQSGTMMNSASSSSSCSNAREIRRNQQEEQASSSTFSIRSSEKEQQLDEEIGMPKQEEATQTATSTTVLPIFRNVPATKPPKETLQAVYNAGIYKAGLTLDVLAVQSFMAGVYIAMAGQLFLSVGGGPLGAALFPTGLIAVILTSGELFTGDALIFVASVLGGRVKIQSLLRNWSVSWCFNFLGAFAWAALLAYLSDALQDLGQDEFAVQVAIKKATQPWGNIFLKGMGANFMVCLGVWQATCAEDVAGKTLALWFPIAGFVIMGLDHCIANQFFIPLGMMLGTNGEISVVDLLFGALLPATLGNIVGGGIFIGAIYWYVFDSMESLIAVRERIRQSRTQSRPAVGSGRGLTSRFSPSSSE